MATYPIKVLLDRNRQPFIPFATTSSIVENGTNRRLDKMLGNLDDLQTNNKNSLVSAINEIRNSGGGGGSSTGWQVVDKLPTENISATTIYLVPKAGAKKPNIYEEWVWVNNDWENIGTTEIDLSGYATTSMIGDLNTLQTTDKDCIVDAINEIVGTAGGTSANIGNLNDLNTEDKSSIVNAINEVMDSVGTYIPIDYIVTDALIPFASGGYIRDIYEQLSNVITNKLNREEKGFVIYLDSTSSSKYTGLYYSEDLVSTNNNTYTFYKYIGSRGNADSYKARRFVVNGSWTDGVYTPTSVRCYVEDSEVLTKYNTSVFTPTGDYHPATKKYVDDTVAAAGAGSGSAFDPAKYLAIDNTTEYTPTDLYHPATKAYVDGLIASVPEPVDAYSKTEVDGKLANYLSKTNTESYTPTSDYHPATKKFVESVVASIPGPDLSGYYTKGEVDNAIDNIEFPTTDLSGYYTKDDIKTLLKGYNTRLVYNDWYGGITFQDPDNLTETYDFLVDRTRIYNVYGDAKRDKANDKLCVFKPNALTTRGRYYIEVTFSYSSNTGVHFDTYYDYPQLYYVDDEGVEQVLSTLPLSDVTIEEVSNTLTNNSKYTYHYMVDVMGDAVQKDIYIKRYSDITALAATSDGKYAMFDHPCIDAKVLV